MLPDKNRTGLSGIYQIRHLASGKAYIGSAANFQRRWKSHRYDLTRGNHHSQRLQRAWLKYGKEAFIFEILEIVPDKADLIRKEQEWFDRVRPYDRKIGYNSTPVAGSQFGFKHSLETRKKMSDKKKAHLSNPTVRAAMSMSRKGQARGPEEQERLRNLRTGMKASAEILAKMSESQKGKVIPPCQRAKISAALSGKKQSPESIERRASSNRGKRRSDEVRARMSVAQKRRFSDPAERKKIPSTKGCELTLAHRAKLSEAKKSRKAND